MNFSGLGFGRYLQDNYPQALPFGIHERYFQHVENASLSAGTNVLNADTVPSGEIWVITGFSFWATPTVPSSIYIGKYDGTNVYYLYSIVPPTGNVVYLNNIELVLIEDDRMRVECYGATATESLDANFWGYKMKVDGN